MDYQLYHLPDLVVSSCFGNVLKLETSIVIPANTLSQLFRFIIKKLPFFKFYASPPLILNSHEFCKHKVSKNDGGLGVGYYHINEINNEWSTDPSTELIMDNIGKNWFTTFDGSNARVDGAIYNCRHMLLRASSLKEIPRSAIDRAITKGFWKKGIDFEDEEMYFNFEISNPEKREVAGVVLRSGQMIYRADIAGKGSGYVYFSRDTVRKLKEKYGLIDEYNSG